MADLSQLRAIHGSKPDADMISKFAEEFATLLEGGFLSKIQYGFKRNGLIVFQLEYTAGGGGLPDDRPGRVPATIDLRGATWFSYLTYTSTYYAMTQTERDAMEATLPFQRVGADAPTLASGVYFSNAKSYSTEDLSAQRRVYTDK